MKKTLFTLVALCLSMTFAFAQNPKPKHGKLHPTLIKAEPGLSAFDGKAILNSKLEMGGKDQWETTGFDADHLGFQHQKFQQYYDGIKVEGGTYAIHSKDGEVKSLSGSFRTVTDLNTVPDLTERSAYEKALAHVGAQEYAWQKNNSLGYTDMPEPTGELVVFTSPEGKYAPRLAYKFDIYASQPLYRAYVFIDAHTGEFIDDFQRIHDTNIPATGNSLYNGNVSFTADNTGTNYRLRQTSSGNGVETYDLNNGTNYASAADVTSASTNFTGDDTAVQAHWGAEQTHSYYLTKHNRNSYNGTGGKLLSYVHYSNNYVNAFWDGTRMTYGDGDGVNYGPLVSLDICAHELTHGVTEHTAALIYQNESGALNESFSDIFGEATENFATGTNDWLMGDQIGAGGSGGALRNMANPNAFSDPDTYGGTYWYTGTADNGGVHTNSGVQNKWFYILSVGESGTNDLGNSYNVTAIGMTKAAEVAYRNLSVYLNSSSNYAAARAGAIQAAIDLYGAGSNEEIQVTNAWYAVGVGAEYQQPIGCVDAVVDLSILLDNYPQETTWDLKTTAGTTIASGGPYSGQAGATITQTFNLADDDYTFTIYDSYGDGICCAYGNGSYTLSSNGTTIVTGGSFASSEATNFCVQAAGGDTQPPTVPGNLTATNITQTSADLNWTASTDNVGVDHYNVYVDGTLNGTTTTLNYTVSGLSPNTTYNMSVTAEDAAGNESAAASVSVTTLPAGGGCIQNAAFNLTIVLDNYPSETTWDIQTTGGTTVASGGSYAGQAGQTISVAINLANDNYVFTIYDSYGDGICCAYGNGSYTLSSNGTTVATGGSFASSESTSFCVDASGGGGGCSGSTVLSQDYFETGWNGWTDGGSDCFRYSGTRSYEGNYSIRIRDNSGAASAMTKGGYDLSTYDNVEIEFYFYPNSMENGEDFWVRYNDGGGWTTVAAYAAGTSFTNNQFYVATVTLSSNQYNLSGNAQFRFQCDASSNADRIYVDGVTVTGICGGALIAGTSGQSIKQLTFPNGPDNMGILGENAAEDIVLFPNPASSYLNLSTDMEILSVRVFSLNGALMKSVDTFENGYGIDVSELKPGFYFISVETADGAVNKKFVKQ